MIITNIETVPVKNIDKKKPFPKSMQQLKNK